MGSIQRKIVPMFVKINLFPNKYLIRTPHKIFEFDYLTDIANVSKTDTILDIGCGKGFQTLIIGKKCKQIIGIDTSKEAIDLANFLSDKCNGKIDSKFLCSKLEQAGFHEGSFDKAFSICVIEHIPNYKEIIGKVYMLLKPRGSFYLSVDALTPIKSSELTEKHKKEHSVQHYFNAQELKEILEKAGFKNVTVTQILRSDYAVKLFTKGIIGGFYQEPTFLLNYLRLKYSEKSTKNKEGIFLCASCTK